VVFSLHCGKNLDLVSPKVSIIVNIVIMFILFAYQAASGENVWYATNTSPGDSPLAAEASPWILSEQK
jgi:hypothetical protein